MKLDNYLYKVKDKNSLQLCAEIILLENSEIYKAHFPGQPVTPGVCIMQMATEILEYLIDKELSLQKVINAKFLSIIDPIINKCIRFKYSKMEYKHDGESQNIKISVSVENNTIIFAKLSLLYAIK